MKILVLSDGKPGHYKQSLGIVQKMTDCQMQFCEVEFQSKWRDNLLRIFMCLFGGITLPKSFSHFLLKWSLHSSSYVNITKIQNADIILSSGSSVAAVNLILGKTLKAKTATCGRPSPVGIRYFDLAILPMTYWNHAKNRKDVCKTIGVPNPISPNQLNSKRQSITEALNLTENPCIGILLGGTDRYETITMEDAEFLSNICEEITGQLNAKILMTTSRRTPNEVKSYLRTRFQNVDWCPLFAEPDIPSEMEDPYQTILSVCDLLIVSADSFSMVCEAASSGRKVIVLSLTRRIQRQPKRHTVYQHMAEESIVNLSSLEKLAEQITSTLTQHTTNVQLQDTKVAANAIRSLKKT